MTTHYHFFSSGRQGLAAAIDKLEDRQKRASVNLLLKVSRKKTTGDWADPVDDVERSVQLYGPGDIIGFDERIITRTDPKPDSGNFEPNYFPAIEFADFDFLWRYSPKPADAKGFTPWIVLIVLIGEDRGDSIKREYEEVTRGREQLPVIKVFKQENLPDLNNAWKWAHVQATSGYESLSEDQLKDIIKTQPECIVSRLLCPRRLQPKTLYTAFVVPAYKLGWAAGIDSEIARTHAENCNADDPAWDADSSEPIDLPYYYRWDFRTSVRGDFEHLVRMLEPRELEGLGRREMDCKHPGFGLSVDRSDIDNEEKKHLLDMEGALKSFDTEYTPWGKDKEGPLDSLEPEEFPEPEEFQVRLADEVLNKGNNDGVQLEIPSGFFPKLPGKFYNNIISDISFNTLKDEKSVLVSWVTSIKTFCQIRYGVKRGDNNLEFHSKEKFKHSHHAKSYANNHRAIIKLNPEKIYVLKIRIINSEKHIDVETGVAYLRISLPAVVPPIYGRWHAARSHVKPGRNENAWLDVLNLDPRHRAAAGLGAEIVRRQQEGLMSSAWDQIGEIENANDILRRAQLGRESSNILHDRLGLMAIEDYLRATTPVQKRIVRYQDDSLTENFDITTGTPGAFYSSAGVRSMFGRMNISSKLTISTELDNRSKIPCAALDPAFRRISRARGPIRKRQYRENKRGRQTDMLRRMARGELQPAGKHPKIEGTKTPCDITKEMIAGTIPSLSLFGENASYEVSGDTGILKVTLIWESNNISNQLIASGAEKWSGNKDPYGSEEIEISYEIKYEPPPINSDDVMPPIDVSDGLAMGGDTSGGSDTYTPGGVSSGGSDTYTPGGVSSGGSGTFTPGGVSSDGSGTFTPGGVSSDGSDTFTPGGVSSGGSNGDDWPDESGGKPITESLEWTFTLTGQSIACKAIASVRISVEDSTISTMPEIEVMPTEIAPKEIDAPALRFCEEQITCEQLRNAIDAGVEGVDLDDDLLDTICDAFSSFLIPEEEIDNTPSRDQSYFDNLRDYIHAAIDPRTTIKERTKLRLKLRGRLAERFEDDNKDPLDEIMACPVFPQPMYEPLRELSESHILPGVEKVPQNTIALLKTNRRFLESYMVGLNHEFAAELLWRGFPTDQRGTCFRQFWDVSEYIDEEASETIFDEELNDNVPEHLKDIPNLTEWKNSHLGANDNRSANGIEGKAVLVIRGDLLKRYPNAVIYSVNARLEYYENDKPTGNFIPDLPEYNNYRVSIDEIEVERANICFDPDSPPANPSPAEPTYPIFRGSLGADLVFLGFPFYGDEAKSSPGSTGRFFIFEERISEARFGLDTTNESVPESETPEEQIENESVPESETPEEQIEIGDWSNLSWKHFKLADKAGEYVDSSGCDILRVNEENEVWNEKTPAALRARITRQKPVRLAIHADQMIPDVPEEKSQSSSGSAGPALRK